MELTAPLDDDSVTLLRTIRRGARRRTDWPVWQWVRLTAGREGVDADAVLARLPTGQLSYRPVFRQERSDGVGGDGDPIGLTVQGLFHAGDEFLAPAFVGALAEVAERAAAHVSDPHQVTSQEVHGDEVTAAVTRRSGHALLPQQLYDLVRNEPPTWLGHSERDGQWMWDLTQPRHLSAFVGVRDVVDYLHRLDAHMVGLPASVPALIPLAPLALLDAVDHLDAEWRQLTGDRLLQPRRTVSFGALTQPVATVTELAAACTAFFDVIDAMQPGTGRPGDPALQRLDSRLGQLLPADRIEAAQAAVASLRYVVDLRHGQQHGSDRAYDRQLAARRHLGLPATCVDPAQEWTRIGNAIIDAFRQLRQQLPTDLTT